MKKHFILLIFICPFILYSCNDNLFNDGDVITERIEFGTYFFDECKNQSYYFVIDTFSFETKITARVTVAAKLSEVSDKLYLIVRNSQNDTVHLGTLDGSSPRERSELFYFPYFKLQEVGEYNVDSYYLKDNSIVIIPTKKIYIID